MQLRYFILGGAAVLTLHLTAFGASNSPVADAAQKGDKAGVRSLIQRQADVNATQADGATAIQWAAYRNDPEMADILIAAGANVKAANHDGATALFLASVDGNAAVIERLLKAGADSNEHQPFGETPIMFAARSGSVEAIKVLLDHKGDVNAKETVRGTTALMWAAEQGHPAAVKTLIAAGADVSVMSAADTKGNKAYIAPTARQRAINDGIALDGTFSGGRGGGRRQAAPAGDDAAVADATPAGGRGSGRRQAVAAPRPAAPAADDVAAADEAAAQASFGRGRDKDGGGLTALVYAAREDCLECARILIDAGAKVNQTTRYGWTPLLTATQNRHYKLAVYLLEHEADPNIATNGGWRPLYIATDNRNIESGDYPVRKPDMDHLEYIKLLLDHGADVNARVCGVQSTPQKCVGDSTETRTNFTMQWLYEDGATPFLRAAQSGDVTLMKLLLAHGADPKISTTNGDTPLSVAAGIGWVEGVTFERSEADNLEAVKMCLDLGLDPNARDGDGRVPLHGAGHKGSNSVVQLLVDRGAKLDVHDDGSRDTISGSMYGHTWLALDYAQGLVRVGVQSAIAHPDTADLIRKLMAARGMEIPEPLKASICLAQICR
jgi:ankyrin repeat protein